MTNKPLTVERVRELLRYDPDTGVFRWRVTRGGTARVGAVAGWKEPDGYVRIQIDGENYFAHRLAWFCVHGVWPKDEIDHVNGARSDNRMANLRLATRAENARNRPLSIRSKIGLKGVQRQHRSRTFCAIIRVGSRRVRLSGFDTPEKAHEAYCKASAELHGEFGRTQ